jgi:hypothetical protein
MLENMIRLSKRLRRYGVLGLVLIWTGCQTQPHLVLERVGPASSGTPLSKVALIGSGYLVVYSATETRHSGKSLKVYPHTSYVIETEEGKFLKWISNATGPIDENPSVVRLRAGFYKIRAQDDNYGRITVPVLIQDGQTTTVHLETRAVPATELLDANNSVRLPDGRFVGRRAQEPAQSRGE